MVQGPNVQKHLEYLLLGAEVEGLGLSWAPVEAASIVRQGANKTLMLTLQLLGMSWQSPVSSWSAPWGSLQSALASSCFLVGPAKMGKRGVHRAVRQCLGLADLIVLPGQRGDTACLFPWSDL